MWGELFKALLPNLVTAILGPAIQTAFTSGANALFGPKTPSRGDMTRDIQAQAEALRGAQTPIRTAEQVQSDQLALEQNRARQATFTQLSNEYSALQKAGPEVFWNPYEEERIKQEAMGEAAGRGMAESGQAQEHVRRRLEESRIGRSQEAARLHAEKLSGLRTGMLPYTNVQAPGSPPLSAAPQVEAMPRTVRPPFASAPFDVASALRLPPKKPGVDEKALGLAQPYYDVGQQAI